MRRNIHFADSFITSSFFTWDEFCFEKYIISKQRKSFHEFNFFCLKYFAWTTIILNMLGNLSKCHVKKSLFLDHQIFLPRILHGSFKNLSKAQILS